MSEPRVDGIDEIPHDPDRFYIIAETLRIGSQTFMTALEWRYFDPRYASKNEKFEVFLSKFEGMILFVASVPGEYKDKCYEVAEDYGMRIVDGSPVCIGKEINAFHLKGSNVKSLSNNPDSTNYDNANRVEHIKAEQAMNDDVIKSELRRKGMTEQAITAYFEEHEEVYGTR